MAMFFFRLKSDKKPDGTKVSAVQHVDYIRREGNFAEVEQWEEKNKFVDNFISSAEVKDACGGQNFLLYKTDDFGSIRNSENGIEVTGNFSPTTLAIALTLADKTMNHQPLIISGSPYLKKSVINAALLADLNISFADKFMQYEFTHQKETLENDRKKFVANGGTLVTKRPIPKPAFAPTHAKTIETVAKKGLRLPTLSQINLVHSESEGTDLFLQDDESRQLEQLTKNIYHNVRWNFSSERKKLAEQTAEKIWEHINEHLQQVSAKSHVEYINREKAFANHDGCIFHSHRLPKWEKNDQKKFFRAADFL